MAELYSFIGVAAVAAIVTFVIFVLMLVLHAHLVLGGRFRWYRIPARVGQLCLAVAAPLLATNLKFWASILGNVRTAEAIVWGIGMILCVAVAISIHDSVGTH